MGGGHAGAERLDGDAPPLAPKRRRGRPRAIDETGPSTRERLVEAATVLCAEEGFEGVTIGDVARLAGVTPGAIYNHFGGRSELMVEAGRQALHGIGPEQGPVDPAFAVRQFLAPAFARTRRLLAELHLAAPRHPDLAQLLADWHEEQAQRLFAGGADPVGVKALYLVLLGCCQLEALPAIDAGEAALTARLAAVASTIAHPEDAP